MSKRKSNSDETTSKRRKKYSTMSDDEKTMAATLYVNCSEVNLKKVDFIRLLKASGYEVAKSSIERWASSVRKGEAIVQADKMSGAERALDEHQMRVFVGYILTMILQQEQVSRATGVDFIRDTFDIEVSAVTVGKYYVQNNFVRRQATKKSVHIESI